MWIFQVRKLILVIHQVLKRIPDQESSGTLTGLKAVPRRLSLVSVTAVITSGYMQPRGERALVELSFKSRECKSLLYSKCSHAMFVSFVPFCVLFVCFFLDAFWSALLDPLRDTAGKCKVRSEIQPPLTTALTSYHVTDRTPPALPPNPGDPSSTDHT